MKKKKSKIKKSTPVSSNEDIQMGSIARTCFKLIIGLVHPPVFSYLFSPETMPTWLKWSYNSTFELKAPVLFIGFPLCLFFPYIVSDTTLQQEFLSQGKFLTILIFMIPYVVIVCIWVYMDRRYNLGKVYNELKTAPKEQRLKWSIFAFIAYISVFCVAYILHQILLGLYPVSHKIIIQSVIVP